MVSKLCCCLIMSQESHKANLFMILSQQHRSTIIFLDIVLEAVKDMFGPTSVQQLSRAQGN